MIDEIWFKRLLRWFRQFFTLPSTSKRYSIYTYFLILCSLDWEILFKTYKWQFIHSLSFGDIEQLAESIIFATLLTDHRTSRQDSKTRKHSSLPIYFSSQSTPVLSYNLSFNDASPILRANVTEIQVGNSAEISTPTCPINPSRWYGYRARRRRSNLRETENLHGGAEVTHLRDYARCLLVAEEVEIASGIMVVSVTFAGVAL